MSDLLPPGVAYTIKLPLWLGGCKRVDISFWWRLRDWDFRWNMDEGVIHLGPFNADWGWYETQEEWGD